MELEGLTEEEMSECIEKLSIVERVIAKKLEVDAETRMKEAEREREKGKNA